MVNALRVRDFRLLWFGSVISLLGSWLLVVAIPAYVFRLTGSVAATGETLAAEFLPPALLGPLAGVLADRWDRRRTMIAADLLRVGAVALLLLVRDADTVWLAYVAVAAENVGTVLFRPAAQAYTPLVVGTGETLSSANALNAVAEGVVRLLGGPLGGVLLVLAGFDLLVWLDAGTYLVSALAVLATTRITAPRPAARRITADLAAGVAFLRTHRTTATLVLLNTVFLGANATLTALLVPFGVTVLGGSAQTGLVMSALGVGFLLGAPLLRLLPDRAPPAWQLGGSLAGTGVAFGLLFTSTTLFTALPAAALVGMAGSLTVGGIRTLVQRLTPNDLLGRVSAAMFTAEALATLAGALAGPAVAGLAGVVPAACLAGAIALLAGVFAALRLPRAVIAGVRD